MPHASVPPAAAFLVAHVHALCALPGKRGILGGSSRALEAVNSFDSILRQLRDLNVGKKQTSKPT